MRKAGSDPLVISELGNIPLSGMRATEYVRERKLPDERRMDEPTKLTFTQIPLCTSTNHGIAWAVGLSHTLSEVFPSALFPNGQKDLVAIPFCFLTQRALVLDGVNQDEWQGPHRIEARHESDIPCNVLSRRPHCWTHLTNEFVNVR